MDNVNAATLIEMANAIDRENHRLNRLLTLALKPSTNFSDEDKADLNKMIHEAFAVRDQRICELKKFAAIAPEPLDAKLYGIARELGQGHSGVPAMVEEVAVEWERQFSGDKRADEIVGDATPKEADPRDQQSLEARALALLVDHPDWSDTVIAKEVGCSRTSLYRLEKFTAARRELRTDGKASRPRGSKANGHLEAWDVDE